MAMLLSHSQTSSTTTPARAPYVLPYEEKLATYKAKPSDTTIQTMTATAPPGDTHRNPPCLALGEAQYRIANIRLTRTTSTGHLAMLHMVTAVEPTPRTSP